MKYNLISALVTAVLASPLVAPVYASSVDDIFTQIDQGTSVPEQPPEQQITEDAINGVWKVLKRKLPFTFKTGKVPGVLTVVAGALEKALVPLSNLLNEYSIEHGSVIEYLTYLPPNFDDNAFSIAAYDAYHTKGKFTGELRSETDEVLFQIKVYPEFSAISPTTYKLKNLENLHIPVNANAQNLVLEFYNADGSQRIDSLVLPAKKNNRDFGITLAKTKDGSHVYYLKKETRHHITNIYTIDKLLDPLYEYPASDRSTVERRLAAMDSWEAAQFDPFVWQKARESSKVELSSHPRYYDSRVYSSDYILSLWQDPKWLLRGAWTYHYGANNYSDFTDNATATEDRGMMLGLGGKATYQLFIPKTGTYGFRFHFTNSEQQHVSVTNPLTGENLYSVTLPASEDGQPQSRSTREVELELEEGLLFLEVSADNVQVDGTFYEFLRNDGEDRQAYLESMHDTIRREIINADYYLDQGNAKPLQQDDIEGGLLHANFLLDNSIIPKINDLTIRGYDVTEPLMVDLSERVMGLKANIVRTKTNQAFLQSGIVTIEGEDYAYSSSTSKEGDFLRFDDSIEQGRPIASYVVHIPEAGNYLFSYRVAKDHQLDGEGFIIDKMFDNLESVAIAPSQGEFQSQQGGTFYLGEGQAVFYLYSQSARFDLDKIELHYQE